MDVSPARSSTAKSAFGRRPGVRYAVVALVLILGGMTTLAICQVSFGWEGFWRAAAQPYATLIAGSAALGAGLLALFNGDLQRAADAEHHEVEQGLESGRLASQQTLEIAAAERLHRRELTKDLRARFTTITSQLADDNPTIRRSGVYAMAALADDWADLDAPNERQVCVDVLTAYLTTPNPTLTVFDVEFAHSGGADGAIRAIIIRLLTEHREDVPTRPAWTSLRYDLRAADLAVVSGVGAHLADAQLERASLVAADFTGARFDSARMAGASLVRATLIKCKFDDADLAGADLSHARLGKDITPDEERATSFVGATLSYANMSGALAPGTIFRNARMIQATLDNAVFTGADLINAHLAGASGAGVNFAVAQLLTASLVHAELTDSVFAGADMSHARLLKAKLHRADLYGADLTRADLRGADLTGADLRGANLTDAELTAADGIDSPSPLILDDIVWDSSTIWPDGFEPPPSVAAPSD